MSEYTKIYTIIRVIIPEYTYKNKSMITFSNLLNVIFD